MLVEDDAILVEMYQAKFEIEGHEIVVATNGQECLNLLEDYLPDIILLDILMPKLNGFHVLKEIKKRPGLRRIPLATARTVPSSGVRMVTIRSTSPRLWRLRIIPLVLYMDTMIVSSIE